jgi:hypothetical protein
MTSFRKRNQDHIEAAPHRDAPPVSTPPATTAEPPPVESQPPEMPETKDSPAEAAGKDALRQRLQEMERAESFQRQQPPPHAEPQQRPEMPPAVAKWLAEHPQYADPRDPISQAEIQLAGLKTARDGLTWDDDNFIPSIERHLGLRQQPQPQQRPQPQPQRRYEAPPRQQQRSAPVSAPPSREPPSMRSGRPQSFRTPLNADELEIARASGITPERYAQEKEKMLRLKAAGVIQDGQ